MNLVQINRYSKGSILGVLLIIDDTQNDGALG
jgi:hypothetical protein